MSASVQTPVQVVVSLTVISGPDVGMRETFDQPRVRIGRDVRNDFVLSDGFVSGEHGELIVKDADEVIYRDLESRHGSLVLVNNRSRRLHEETEAFYQEIEDGAEVQVGCSLIRIGVEPMEQEDAASGGAASETTRSKDRPRVESDSREKMITQAISPVKTINQQFAGDDRRLAILFRLAGRLNSATGLEEILDMVVEATFDAFPNANFFGITLVDDPDEVDTDQPFYTHVRGDVPGEDEEPIISTSIVDQVVQTGESVLFLKDSLGSELTESILEAQITACLCAPLVGQRSILGVMQVDTRGRGGVFSRRDLDLFSVLASNVAFALERTRLSENIVEMFESFVAASINAIEARDPNTAGHSERVTRYTLELAREINAREDGALADVSLSRQEMTELRYAALLHDFGKIAVRADILQKARRLSDDRLELIGQRFETIKSLRLQRTLLEEMPEDDDAIEAIKAGHEELCDNLDATLDWLHEIAECAYVTDEDAEKVRELGQREYVDAAGESRPFLTDDEIENLTIQRGTLNSEEWDKVRSHPTYSREYLERIPWSEDLARIPTIAGNHHEKLDGSGYPRGVSAEALSPQVRMLSVADIFDALTATDRPYRDAFSVEKAVDILREEAAEGKLDEVFVEIFAQNVVPRIRKLIPDG